MTIISFSAMYWICWRIEGDLCGHSIVPVPAASAPISCAARPASRWENARSIGNPGASDGQQTRPTPPDVQWEGSSCHPSRRSATDAPRLRTIRNSVDAIPMQVLRVVPPGARSRTHARSFPRLEPLPKRLTRPMPPLQSPWMPPAPSQMPPEIGQQVSDLIRIAVARNRCQDPEEVFGRVQLRVIARWHTYDPSRSSLPTWIDHLVRSENLDMLKAESRRSERERREALVTPELNIAVTPEKKSWNAFDARARGGIRAIAQRLKLSCRGIEKWCRDHPQERRMLGITSVPSYRTAHRIMVEAA